MKIAAYRYGTLYLLMVGALIALGLVLFLTGVITVASFFLSVVIFAMASWQPFACTVVIDEGGVKAYFLFFRRAWIKWDEVREVGAASQNERGQKYIYFAREPLDADRRSRILRVRQNGAHVWAQMSKDVLAEVRKHYKGKIRYFKETDLM